MSSGEEIIDRLWADISEMIYTAKRQTAHNMFMEAKINAAISSATPQRSVANAAGEIRGVVGDLMILQSDNEEYREVCMVLLNVAERLAATNSKDTPND